MAIQRRRPDIELDRRRRRRRRTSVTPNADVTPDATPATPARRRGFVRRVADALRRAGQRLQGTGNN